MKNSSLEHVPQRIHDINIFLPWSHSFKVPQLLRFQKINSGARRNAFSFLSRVWNGDYDSKFKGFPLYANLLEYMILKQCLPLFLKIVKLNTQANDIFFHISVTFVTHIISLTKAPLLAWPRGATAVDVKVMESHGPSMRGFLLNLLIESQI